MNGAPAESAVASRLADVRGRVAAAARAVGRDPDEVRLVAVRKTRDVDAIAAAAAAGQREFGESRAQELRDKLAAAEGVLPSGIRWHFVGRLQRNKVKYVAGRCALIHSVDRWPIAQAIADRAEPPAAPGETRQPVLAQVNVDDDPAKAGVPPDAVAAFVDRLAALEGVRCIGLMTVPALDADPAPAFDRLRRLRDEVQRAHPDVTELSMGMSRDFETAIAEGATIVRIGEAIFGPRPEP